MDLYLTFAILLGISLLISAIGFYRFIYFISIGYGFSITGMAIFLLLINWQQLTWSFLLHGLFLMAYGLRLGVFLLQRELKQTYRKEMAATQKETDPIKGFGKAGIWICVAVLYVLMISTLAFQGAAGGKGDFFSYLGIAIMLAGILFEGLADKQKSAFKAQSPSKFCNVGLFRLSRCPNYFGEITFWLGNFIAGVAIYRGVAAWLITLTGFLGIVFIMLVSTVRLELKQNNRYGEETAYQEYIQSVPVLIPFIPIYSLKKLSGLTKLRI
jgi:steroid 5-alpha reductase family enzyme